jgi:hypothetical protein
MQERYSSVAGDEVRASLAKVISLAGLSRVGKAVAEVEAGQGGDAGQSGYASGYAEGAVATG